MDKQIQDSKNKDMREKKQADGAEEQAEDHKAKRRLVKNIPLLIAEICMLVAAVVILYVVVTATDEVERRPIDKGRIIINKEVKQTQKKKKEEQKVSKGTTTLRCSVWMPETGSWEEAPGAIRSS